MPLTSASRHVFFVSHDVVRANRARSAIEELDDQISTVSNSLSASKSVIDSASSHLARELAPVLLKAMQHVEAAQPRIESAKECCRKNIPQLEHILRELNKGRLYRNAFRGGNSLKEKEQRLYNEIFDVWEKVDFGEVIQNKTAEQALQHATQLAEQLESSLNGLDAVHVLSANDRGQ